MRVINLASGSDGNITYIESETKKIILDMGLSCAETVKRLELIGVNPSEISAILVTHEHIDHIKGIDVFSSKYNTPVYAHQDVWVGLDDKFKKVSIQNRKIFEGQFDFEDILVTPVEVPHDVKCFGFGFNCKNSKVSVVTDLGHMNEKILNTIKGSQLVYLEANYDKKMLYEGTKYPLSLKRRIDGPNGHLSNMDSADAIDSLILSSSFFAFIPSLWTEEGFPKNSFSVLMYASSASSESLVVAALSK